MSFRAILFFLFLNFSLQAQSNLPLSFWSDVMVNANSPQTRGIAFDHFYTDIKILLQEPNAFDYDFKSIPELSVLSDSLSTFKLLSWQVDKGDNKFEYYGFLINHKNQTFELHDALSSLSDIEFIELNDQEWLGGLYYNLIEMGNQYYIFSYRQLDKFTKFKSFDCLSFAEDGSPILGKESFVFPQAGSRNIIKSRVVFKYSVDAVLSLNYNSDMQMVVHDHLMQVIGQLPGQGPTLVPDGTYEGYQFEEGKWVYEEKLFSHTYDVAPRPVQILGKDKKDIFGKEKKNK